MKKVCITYHMTRPGEVAETCITLPLDDAIAKDLLKNQENSAYVVAPRSHKRPSIPALLNQLATLQGYDRATFCCAEEARL